MTASKISPDIRIISVSGRIGCGSTTLAKRLSEKLGWKHIEGGEIFWESVRKKLGLSPKDTNLRPDEEDQLFDNELKRMLREDNNIILETKLAGFNAEGITGIFKILLVCDDENGKDQTQVRIDRLVNREHLTVEQAKEEVLKREENDISKWRKMYASSDPQWTYYDKKYYDLVINTFMHNQDETVQVALDAMNN